MIETNKVLFVATVDKHITSFHLPYLKLFQDEGYEVHVATNSDEEISYCNKKHKISIERNPFKINNIKAVSQLKKIINEEKFNIIHCHTPMGGVVARLAGMSARKNGTRVIYTAHGFHFFKGAPIINWLMFYQIEKYLSKYTDTLITINIEDYELAKNKFKTKQIEYVPGVGVDETKFDFVMTEEEKEKLRQEVGVSKNNFVLICIGELNKNKNQIMIINAMKSIVQENNNIHLLLAGDGDLKTYYEEKIKEYNLEKNIHLLGYRRDIPKLLKISHLGISLSKREGLGINLIEEMFSGLPTVATNNRGHQDVIKNETNGILIEINNIKSLKTAILRFNNDKAFYETVQKEIFDSTKHFSLHLVMNKMSDIYNLNNKNKNQSNYI